jgi:hypothetical protein
MLNSTIESKNMEQSNLISFAVMFHVYCLKLCHAGIGQETIETIFVANTLKHAEHLILNSIIIFQKLKLTLQIMKSPLQNKEKCDQEQNLQKRNLAVARNGSSVVNGTVNGP